MKEKELMTDIAQQTGFVKSESKSERGKKAV